MDKNKIKAYAVWARRSLIAQVSDKANRIGIYEDKILEAIAVQGGFTLEGKEEIFPLPISNRDALINQIKEKGYNQVMEEVAYTWFNRFMALRYMEVNDFLPSGVRILSSEVEGKKEPDVLTRVSEVIDELNLNANEIYDLLDSGNTLDREKAYRIILVKQCNELGKIIPQMFEKISDYTELLLPDNLLEDGSVIRKMVEDIEEGDWKEEVEIIGWMYQYYISEKKDEVFAALKKNVKITKENIPAATQLFTPKWIVKYMVENSLGRLWLEGHPNEELQKEWKYYLEEAEQEPEVEEELQKIREEHSKLRPEDIKVLDPCMGSGHILVYAFDVLYEIYKTAGYSEREIPRMILQNNLYGLDIDDRAAQLASFALIMKARHYNRRLFREIEREHLELNLCSIQESNTLDIEEIDYFCNVNTKLDTLELRRNMEYLCDTFRDAKEYGSILDVKQINFEILKDRLYEIEKEYELTFADTRKVILERLPVIIKQAEIMSRKYEVCITNPPYMGRKGMDVKLINYADNYYTDSKSDLFSMFIEACTKLTKNFGKTALVTMHSWMFLSSYEKLREKMLLTSEINSILHLGMEAFDGVMGKVVSTVAFISSKYNCIRYNLKAVRLVDFYDSRRYQKHDEFFNINNHYKIMQEDFLKIPGKPIAYWASNRIIKVFEEGILFDNIGNPQVGMQTSNNDKFLRMWFEVKFNEFDDGSKKWIKYIKGGAFRKWYGNLDYVLWYNSSPAFILQQKHARVLPETVLTKIKCTWTDLATNKFSCRDVPNDSFHDISGHCFYPNKENKYWLLGYCNSIVFQTLINMINSSLHYQVGDVAKIPVIKNNNKNLIIEQIVSGCINISKNDWDSFETSWDFKVHPLLKSLDKVKQHRLESVFRIWETKCEENFAQLKANEEELNRIFIDIYGLQDELTPEVEDKDITIRKADRERDIKSLISYAVGCMLGRYSIDAEGLIYAGGEFNDKWNIADKKVRKIEKDEEGNITSDTWIDASFLPDVDNVIPITEDEYFEDDIVTRFIDFVRTVYGNDTLEENLDFIADSIGRKTSETSRQAIRRYFIKDFYKDHLKVYQKRPIYWMFESGKNDGFKALIYMHRYNDQTIAKVRTDYLHTLQRKYEAEINRLQLVVDSEEYTTKDKTAAKKQIVRISKQIEECKEYDQVVAHLANEKISIDLDDGVKVNYAKFQDIKIINLKDKEVKMNLLAKI